MQEPVLVLNANFEPIHVCSTRRAIGLILAGKADMIVNGRGHIRTISQLLPRPSVIRLETQVHRPRPHVKLTRREIFRRDNYTCQYCGRREVNLTVDHVIPRHMGGQHKWTNLVTACSPCNHHKGGRKVEEAHMHLMYISAAERMEQIPQRLRLIFLIPGCRNYFNTFCKRVGVMYASIMAATASKGTTKPINIFAQSARSSRITSPMDFPVCGVTMATPI